MKYVQDTHTHVHTTTRAHDTYTCILAHIAIQTVSNTVEGVARKGAALL